jgi:hypothetical protein
MGKEFVVILVEDEESCAVKKVSANTFDQIKDMLGDGEDDLEIVDSIVELSTTEDNILANGLSKEEAVDYAKDISDDYVVLDVF